jgi:hypothetical protein
MAFIDKKRQRAISRKNSASRSFSRRTKRNKFNSIQESGDSFNAKLFKRVVENAGYQAAQHGMQAMGFIVVAEKDFIVKQYPDGRTEKIASIDKIPKLESIILD